MAIPAGFRFCPRDGELVVHYLQRKINNLSLPCDIVKEVDLYRYEDPVELIANNESMMEQNEWYFFTRRTMVSKHKEGGSNVDRKTPKGFWRTSNSKAVTHRGEVVGSRTNLAFYYNKPTSNPTPTKKEKCQKTNWLMNEFTLETGKKGGDNSMKLNEWVLCKVYNHKDSKDTKNTPPDNSCSTLMNSSIAELPETVHAQSGSELANHEELPAPTGSPQEWTDEELEIMLSGFSENGENNNLGFTGEEYCQQMDNNYMTVDLASTSKDVVIQPQFEPMNINANLPAAFSGDNIELPPTSFNSMEVYQNNMVTGVDQHTQQMSHINGVIQNQFDNTMNCSSELITIGDIMPQWAFAEDSGEFIDTAFRDEERLWPEKNDYTSIFI